MNRYLLSLFMAVAIGTSPKMSKANTPTKAALNMQYSLWEVSIKAGTSFVLNGQSNALAHRFRQSIRAEFAYKVASRLQIGGELVVPLDFDRNYRMLGGLVNAKVSIHDGEIYKFKMLGGFGLGFGPKILSTELSTEEIVRLWYQTAMQHRWQVVPRLMSLGLDIGFENLSVITANIVIQFDF